MNALFQSELRAAVRRAQAVEDPPRPLPAERVAAILARLARGEITVEAAAEALEVTP